MKHARHSQFGFSLIELLIAITLGILLVGVAISAYVAQSRVYMTTHGQASVQDAENAIAALVGPVVRAAGFLGCSTIAGASSSNLVSGGPAPLSTLATASTPSAVAGYDAVNTAGDGTILTISVDNPANDADASHWSPALDPTLAGKVLPGSDVVVVLGPVAGSHPVGVTAATPDMLTLEDASGLAAGQILAVSDCGKSTVFQATGIDAGRVTHAAGAAPLANATATLPVAYAPGAQVVALSQTAFFVAQGQAGQSVLVRATLTGNDWNVEELVPGVETLQALYGTMTNNVIAQYVPASAVTDWSSVASVRLAFLIEGQAGSGTPLGAASAPMLLGTTINPPPDTRLRHAYTMTINLRNATP
jgi:type IV pilus assembly protein PilW